MSATPLRAELQSRAVGSAVRLLLGIGIAVGVVAVAGRGGDLNLSLWEAIAIPAAVLVVALLYAGRRRRLRESLQRLPRLEADAERSAPRGTRWPSAFGQGVVAGLVVGGIALLLDIEIDNLVLLLAIALGAVVGDDASGAFLLDRYERDQVGTVYRVEDPSGTDAGLAWLPGRGE